MSTTGVFFQSCSNILLDNVKIYDSNYAFSITAVSNLTLKNSLANNNRGLFLHTTDNGYLYNNNFENNLVSNLYFYLSENNTFYNNQLGDSDKIYCGTSLDLSPTYFSYLGQGNYYTNLSALNETGCISSGVCDYFFQLASIPEEIKNNANVFPLGSFYSFILTLVLIFVLI